MKRIFMVARFYSKVFPPSRTILLLWQIKILNKNRLEAGQRRPTVSFSIGEESLPGERLVKPPTDLAGLNLD